MAKRMPRVEAEKSVGYGNPPIRTRFKKGQSGNPGGRPKGAGSFAAALRAEGDVLVTLPVNGKPIRRTKRQFLAMAAWAEALKGNLKYFEQIIKIDNRLPQAEDEIEEFEYEIRLNFDAEPPEHIRLQQLANILSFKEDPEILAMFPDLLEKYPSLRPTGQQPQAQQADEPDKDELDPI